MNTRALECFERLQVDDDAGFPTHSPLHLDFSWAHAAQEVPTWDKPSAIPLDIPGRTEEQDEQLMEQVLEASKEEFEAYLEAKDTKKLWSSLSSAGEQFLIQRAEGHLDRKERCY